MKAVPLPDAEADPDCERVAMPVGLPLVVAVGVRPCVTVPVSVAVSEDERLRVPVKEPVCVPVTVPL